MARWGLNPGAMRTFVQQFGALGWTAANVSVTSPWFANARHPMLFVLNGIG
jgi:hypothetical protein